MTDEEVQDPAVYNAYVAQVRLDNVEVVRLLGERLADGPVEGDPEIEITAQYQRRGSGEVVVYRYDATCRLPGTDGTEVGRVHALVHVHTVSGEPGPDWVVERFGRTSGAFVAHPYVREAIGTTAHRVGFPGVVLPMIKALPPPVVEE